MSIKRRRFVQGALAGTSAMIVGLPLTSAAASSGTGSEGEAMKELIEGMPKAELHVHLEGTVEPDMAIEFAAKNQVGLPYKNAEELKAALNFNSLENFLKAFDQTISVLKTERDFYETTYHYLQKSRAQNVVYVDLMFDPQAHQRRGIKFGEFLNGIHQAQVDAEKELGIRSQLIMNFQRDASLESAEQAFKDSLEYQDWIVAIGLDNTEIRDFPVKFSDLFKQAREVGYKLTSHCDLGQPNTVEHIRACIEDLGVDRLDHGYNILEDDRLVQIALERELCFTACPTTDFATTDPSTKPYFRLVSEAVKEMLRIGLKVTINTDDPGVMGNRHLSEVYVDAVNFLGLDQQQAVKLTSNAFESLWLPGEQKQEYLSQLTQYVDQAS